MVGSTNELQSQNIQQFLEFRQFPVAYKDEEKGASEQSDSEDDTSEDEMTKAHDRPLCVQIFEGIPNPNAMCLVWAP